jgi:hypothetical protein
MTWWYWGSRRRGRNQTHRTRAGSSLRASSPATTGTRPNDLGAGALPARLHRRRGRVDRFCGRPRDQNPYCPTYARDYWLAWDFGWQDGDHLLDERGAEEARRWLGEKAA